MGVMIWGTCSARACARSGPCTPGGCPLPLCDEGPFPCEGHWPPDVARTIISPGHEEPHRIPQPERLHPPGRPTAFTVIPRSRDSGDGP